MKNYIILAAVSLILLASCSEKNKTGVDEMKMSSMKEDTMKMNGMKHDKNTGKMDRNMKDDMAGMPGMSNEAEGGEVTLNDKQIQLGGIMVDTLQTGLMGDKMVMTATLNVNQNKTTSVSSRVMGRIERLYFKNIGDYVAKGSKLYDLYSEELNNAKQEYRLALQRKPAATNSIIDFEQLIQGARNKLLLWGLNEAQIKDLEVSKNATATTTFYSNAGGNITMLEIKEGDYVMEGGTIVRLADLSSLWAEAQVYSSQLSQIDKTAVALVETPDYPGLRLTGKIEFVNPELNPDTRINLIRINVPNTARKLRPGMPAYVFLNNRANNMTTLPIDAVIRGQDGAIVWVRTAKNTFRSRMVQTGMENGNRIEIKSGLKPGDIIVTDGVFWLNSEFIFKNGTNSMAGMGM